MGLKISGFIYRKQYIDMTGRGNRKKKQLKPRKG